MRQGISGDCLVGTFRNGDAPSAFLPAGSQTDGWRINCGPPVLEAGSPRAEGQCGQARALLAQAHFTVLGPHRVDRTRGLCEALTRARTPASEGSTLRPHLPDTLT